MDPAHRDVPGSRELDRSVRAIRCAAGRRRSFTARTIYGTIIAAISGIVRIDRRHGRDFAISARIAVTIAGIVTRRLFGRRHRAAVTVQFCPATGASPVIHRIVAATAGRTVKPEAAVLGAEPHPAAALANIAI